MKVRNTRALLCTVLFTSLFTSISFADVSAVSDRLSLGGTDHIDWQDYDNGAGVTPISSPFNIQTHLFADGLTVTRTIDNGETTPYILSEPGYFGNTNMPDGIFLYFTNDPYHYVNPISFSDFDGLSVCALGTQVWPLEAGTYTARIEAFNADGSLGGFDFTGATGNLDALFVGIEGTEPMTRVEVSVLNAGSGTYNAYYTINQVDIRACADTVPVLTCEGFNAPMDNYPVRTKKNRVFPLKMELFDMDGFALTGLDLAAAPVVDVMFTSSEGGDPVDVTDDMLSVGKASEGNQFVFEDGIWQFKLSSKGYSASGTYMVTAVSGDESEYVIDPSCVTSFVKE